MTVEQSRRDYRAVSYALCSAIVGVIVMRLIVYFAPLPSSTYGEMLASNALFTLPAQLLFFLIIPFCIYKFYGRKSFVGVLEFSSVRKSFKPIFLVAIPLGLCVWFVTLGVSSGWRTLLDLLGYNYVSSEPDMPQVFNGGFFVAEIVMTAVLPAVCEEFIMRGGMLTTAKRSFDTVTCVIIGAIAFGLFHQNIRQVFYTALFGGLAAFMTIKLKSIYPAMIMHFTNNFCSVYLSYAAEYRWAIGGGFYDGINAMISSSAILFLVVSAIVVVVGAGLAVLMVNFGGERKKVTPVRRMPIVPICENVNETEDATGPSDAQSVETVVAPTVAPKAETVTPTLERAAEEGRYKPTASDVMIMIGVAVTAALTTIFSFVWGFFY